MAVYNVRRVMVDLREEIAKFDRDNRPFPPRSGSVSKPFTGPLGMQWSGYRADFERARADFERQAENAYKHFTTRLTWYTVDGRVEPYPPFQFGDVPAVAYDLTWLEE